MKNTKGITLITLIITVIILLILAAIVLGTLTGDNGLLKITGEAANRWRDAEENDQAKLGEIKNEAEKWKNRENGQEPPDIPEIKQTEVISRRSYHTISRSNRNSMAGHGE